MTSNIHITASSAGSNNWLRSFVPGSSNANAPMSQVPPPMPQSAVSTQVFQNTGAHSQSPQATQVQPKAAVRNTRAATDLSFQSIKNYLRFSYVLLALLVFAIGGWAYIFQIRGAVVAQGTISVAGKPRIIQHLDGGVISDILVKEGDFIAQGDALLKLDPTVINANQASAETNFYANEALISRLLAEKSNQSQIKWSSALVKSKRHLSAIEAMQGQKQLFEARQRAFEGQVSQLQLKISQLEEEVSGVESELNFTLTEFNIVKQDLEKLRGLLQQSLVSRERVTARELDKNRLENEFAKLKSRKEKNLLSIQEARSEINQIYNTRRENVLTDLRTAETQAETFNEALKTVSSKTEHIVIKAPVSGVVHNMEVSTVGGVVIAGQELMQIIPVDDELILQAQLQPQDIDQVSVGQDTKVIFSAVNQKSPPELKGNVQYISADSLTDPVTGMPYFLIKIRIPESERVHLNGQKLIPGMPADVFIQTESRSVMNYLLAPLKKAMSKTMREG